MGAHPYWYFTRYDPDVDAALQALRRREFEAGRYNPATRFIDFSVDPPRPSPGARHPSIEHAREAADADGTRSILDIDAAGASPDFGVAGPLDEAALEELYGTTEPTRAMVQANLDFFERIERGQAVYFTLYKDGRPDELLFAGYSYD